MGNAYLVPTVQYDDREYDALMNTNQGIEDACIMKLSPTCDAIVYCTIFGSAGHEEPGGIAVDREAHNVLGCEIFDLQFDAVVVSFGALSPKYKSRSAFLL